MTARALEDVLPRCASSIIEDYMVSGDWDEAKARLTKDPHA